MDCSLYTWRSIVRGIVLLLSFTQDLSVPAPRPVRFLLWDLDERSYSYSVFVSTDREDWRLVRDATRDQCRSWQVITFPLQLVTFVKVVGTYNTANEVSCMSCRLVTVPVVVWLTFPITDKPTHLIIIPFRPPALPHKVFHLVHFECPYPQAEIPCYLEARTHQPMLVNSLPMVAPTEEDNRHSSETADPYGAMTHLTTPVTDPQQEDNASLIVREASVDLASHSSESADVPQGVGAGGTASDVVTAGVEELFGTTAAVQLDDTAATLQDQQLPLPGPSVSNPAPGGLDDENSIGPHSCAEQSSTTAHGSLD